MHIDEISCELPHDMRFRASGACRIATVWPEEFLRQSGRLLGRDINADR